MSWLSEDPWPLAGMLAVLAVVFLVLLRSSQQGKYLIGAGVVVALAVGVIVLERFWVTDRERIEAVVYDLGRAVGRSDADAVLDHMTPDVSLTQGDKTVGGPGGLGAAISQMVPKLDPDVTNPARGLIRGTVSTARFDFLTISRVRANAGRQTRMGQAEFRVYASGSFGSLNFATPTSGTDWSLGFREVDGRWKVQSITATRLPGGYQIPLTASPTR